MAAGFEVLNDLNSIVIDSDYKNFMLSSKGKATTVEYVNPDGTRVYYAIISTDAKSPQVLITNTGSAFFSIVSSSVVGGISTFYIYSDRVASVDYLVFGTDIPPVSTRYGLQVYAETGELAFDSGSNFLRFHDVIQTNGSNSSSYQVYSSGKVIAAGLSFVRPSVIQVSDNPFPQLGRFVDCLQVASSSINLKRLLLGVFPGQPDQSYPPVLASPPQLLVADVTGY